MTQTLEHYREATQTPPPTIKRWHLTGAGLDALHEATVSLPQFGPDELLVRHDACGICFSDIKIINLGPEHPRLQGRDMQAEPVVMGHEVALTVVGVGDSLKEQFHVGQRFIIQADVYYKGLGIAYGYQLDGGMAQYGVVTKEVLNGDEGCYLIPDQRRHRLRGSRPWSSRGPASSRPTSTRTTAMDFWTEGGCWSSAAAPRR